MFKAKTKLYSWIKQRKRKLHRLREMKKKYVIKQERAVRYFTKHLCKKTSDSGNAVGGGGGAKPTYLIIVLPTGACVFRVKYIVRFSRCAFLQSVVNFYSPLVLKYHSVGASKVHHFYTLDFSIRSSGCEMNRTILHYKCRIGRGYV